MEGAELRDRNSGRDSNFGRASGAADPSKDQGNDDQGGMSVRDMAQTAASSLGAGAQDIARRAGEQASAVYEQGGRAGEYLTRNVNEYPAAALLIAGMIGYGIAYLFHGRSFASSGNSDSENLDGRQTRQQSGRRPRD